MNPTKLGETGSRTQPNLGYLLVGFTRVSCETTNIKSDKNKKMILKQKLC